MPVAKFLDNYISKNIPYRFTGKERDEETGLYYYGARYLDSKASRWLSTDPALGDYVPGAPVDDEARKRNQSLPGMGGVFNTVNLHLYHYAGNNPVKYVDPDGNFLFIPFIIAAAITTGMFVGVATNMPSKEEHYNRNQKQTDATYLTKTEAEANGYRRLGVSKGEKNAERVDDYHEMGKGTPNPAGNDKYVRPDGVGLGSSELIFDENGNLVTDSINGGTYNFVDSEKSIPGHIVKDVLPYYIYGNDEKDVQTTTMWERVTGTYKGPIPNE